MFPPTLRPKTDRDLNQFEAPSCSPLFGANPNHKNASCRNKPSLWCLVTVPVPMRSIQKPGGPLHAFLVDFKGTTTLPTGENTGRIRWDRNWNPPSGKKTRKLVSLQKIPQKPSVATICWLNSKFKGTSHRKTENKRLDSTGNGPIWDKSHLAVAVERHRVVHHVVAVVEDAPVVGEPIAGRHRHSHRAWRWALFTQNDQGPPHIVYGWLAFCNMWTPESGDSNGFPVVFPFKTTKQRYHPAPEQLLFQPSPTSNQLSQTLGKQLGTCHLVC